MSKFGKDLIASLSQAVAHARGKKKSMRVTVVPDVRVIRKSRRSSALRCRSAFRWPR